ncbi:uncharacterized protein LOC113146753 [Cyclospora cayetanensis]|uniref:phosphatidylinositol 3-kinase n=1 Tax=Cyclospora cayetanensis TaxID=88456 RepID=A0A6P6RTG2_9EIME|nr:uncharacterized protein LOC113146753 [Cyclospora cayetanensis]
MLHLFATALSDAAFFDAAFLDAAFFDAAFLDAAFGDAEFLAAAFSDTAFLAAAFSDAEFLVAAFFDAAFFDTALVPPAAVTRAFQKVPMGTAATSTAKPAEKALLWAYRFHLLRIPFALPRLLQTVDWSGSSSSSQQQQQEALELLEQADAARLSVEEVLGILLFSKELEPAAAATAAQAEARVESPTGASLTAAKALESSSSSKSSSSSSGSVAAAVHLRVKRLAVEAIEAVPDSEILFFMQQLVQLIRTDQHVTTSGCRLGAALIRRSLRSSSLASSFFWLLQTEKEHSADGHLFVRAEQRFLQCLRRRQRRLLLHADTQAQGHSPLPPRMQQQAAMAASILQLLERQRLCRDTFASLFPTSAAASPLQAQPDDPKADLHSEDETLANDGKSCKKTVLAALAAAAEAAETARTPAVRTAAAGAAGEGVISLASLDTDAVAHASESDEKKKATAAAAAAAAAEFGIPLPFDDGSVLLHIIAQECYVMKSSQYPLVIKALIYYAQPQQQQQETLRLQRFLYKEDDDLRQDVLVLQLIAYMNRILLRYGLDLKLTPYKASPLLSQAFGLSWCCWLHAQVVAFSASDGLIEFLEGCVSFAQVKRENRSLLSFMESASASAHPPGTCAGDAEGSVDALKRNFLASCAGYCVATYLLGVGDRHLDNLLIRPDGRMLHIDFGFILGEDPKPFPPPMKICKEMIEVLGSLDSPEFAYFLHLCCLCFKYLRTHAYPICLLLECMATSSLKDITKNLVTVQGKQPETQQSPQGSPPAVVTTGEDAAPAATVSSSACLGVRLENAAASGEITSATTTTPAASAAADDSSGAAACDAATAPTNRPAPTAASPPRPVSSSSSSSTSGRRVCIAIERVKERFRLDLSDEEAEEALVQIIISSAGALIPAVVDRLHEWAIYWK